MHCTRDSDEGANCCVEAMYDATTEPAESLAWLDMSSAYIKVIMGGFTMFRLLS